ncbi:MAG: DUF1553 domain-containing protein [Planctomycetes bacterium]|nr:DUF1553 domain-containing protein [Planctomycetota bacterium]
MRHSRLAYGLVIVAALLGAHAAQAIEIPAEQAEFFEKKIRPLLVEKCYECHSEQSKALKGNLRLDTRAHALKGGDSGEAIVPGNPNNSSLIQAVRWQTFEMPPSGKLTGDEVAALVKWVELGAPWPGDGEPAATITEKSYDWPTLRAGHWAWRPVVRPELPAVKQTGWTRNGIDFFVLGQLEAAGLQPSPPATPRVLVRRIYFDLIGLPPTPDEVAAFESACQKGRTKAIADLVDRLLAMPQYGERWGRFWLDVARYNDGYGGFLDNQPSPQAWRYRDWVVNALNNDMPYDEFVRLQLAGDQIDAEKHAVATGFLALGPTYISDGGDPDAIAQAKSETLDDRVDTVCRALMAATVACSRCHDHRFDPYPQLDYYSLAGVFNNTKSFDYPLAPPEVVKAFDAAQAEIDRVDGKAKKIKAVARAEGRKLTEQENKEVKELEAKVKDLQKQRPEKYPFAHTVRDSGSDDMNLAVRGNLRRPGPLAPRRFLRIIAGDDPAKFTHGSGRLDLAEAVVAPANPLTSRVIVNRVWHHHFGFGLVRTLSNFGMLGEQPTHPELLDWLASRFTSRVQGDFAWSLKQLHRAILLSATYQMDSAPNEKAQSIDGDNRLLWRMNPRRMDVEAWRDGLLAVSGELKLEQGGASIRSIAESPRRTIYAAVSRNGDAFDSDSFLRTFDFPVPKATSEGRTSSIVPQQSLFMMNSKFMIARAKALAARLNKERADDPARIEYAYQLLYGRPVTDEELQLGRDFLASAVTNEKQLNPWEQYAQVLLSASEFMYQN